MTPVDAFMDGLDHPMKLKAQSLRRGILALDPEIAETIKWKNPNFHYRDDFATFGFRKPGEIQIVLHRGAKVKETAVTGLAIADPEGLLKWPAKDRALATLKDTDAFEPWQSAFLAIVRQWIATM